MPAPRIPAPHLTGDEIKEKLRAAKGKGQYRRWLAVNLSLRKRLSHHEIAEILGVSVQAVHQWLGAYNREGEKALLPKAENRGRKPFLDSEKEAEIIKEFNDIALKGELVTVDKISSKISKIVGKKVSVGYPYKVLERQRWRKIKPRPTHPKADEKAREDLKKTSLPASWKPPKRFTKTTKDGSG